MTLVEMQAPGRALGQTAARNLLSVTHLSKRYGETTVVDDLSFDIAAFGYGLGAWVGQVTVAGADGATKIPCILFLACGSICMGAMNAA